ncbi:ROK family protein [Micromonospora thermarum]|uniref:ROK family protein n=1 Tax=Micromonospora thermarum TaxID=2720024 RepID=A0ABX0ZD19_9ACTN|nr:ROK family protein [Micromonospora thermarum]NJP35383.1 ROK family protein [Micromonospora thermarum]
MVGRGTKDLRARNRSAVLRQVVRSGETTRAALAGDCSLSPATVTNVVADLIRDRLVEESGSLPSEGGRPIARLRPVGAGAYVIGADVGEHGVTVELFDLSLRRVDRVFRRLATRVTSRDRVAAALTGAVTQLREANPGPDAVLAGIGLGLPGVVDTAEDGTTTIYAQSLGWEPTALDEVVGHVDVPIVADNGAKTLAMAETWFGAATGRSHSIVALVGRGLGIGVIAGGRLLRGSSSSAGEWGHTKVSIGGPMCQCGGRGCLEAYVGGDAVVRRWREAGAEVTGSDEEAFARLIDAAEGGDATAARVLDETVEILGLGLANLVNLFNPEQVVIGGWAGLRLIERRQAQLHRQVARFALDQPAEQVALEPSKIGDDAVAVGAALLALEQFIDGNLTNAPLGQHAGKAQA